MSIRLKCCKQNGRLDMNTNTKCLLLIYIAITTVFVFFVSLNLRSYQDSWILEDVFIATIVYILTFSIVVVTIDDNRIVALVCVIFMVVLNAIPSLKYQFFYGCYDSVAHYGFVKDLLSLGFVPETGFYAPVYSDFPGRHILIGVLSLVLGIPAVTSIKLVASTIFCIIPLMTYFVTNRVFERNIQKYIIIASGLPLMSYALVGTTFALPLFFSFLCLLFRRNIVNKNRRKYTLALMIFALGLLFSHAVTTVVLILLLGIVSLLIQSIDFVKRYSHHSLVSMYIGAGSLLTVSFMAWLMFKADFVAHIFIQSAQRIFLGEIIKKPIPTRLFEIPLSAQLRVFALRHLKDAIIIVLAFAGLLVLLKTFKRENESTFEDFYLPLLCFLSVTLLLLAFQLVIGFGAIEYGRLVKYAMVFTPFLVGLFLWQLNRSSKIRIRAKPIITASVLFMCISLSLIQIFKYQPLVPRADVLSEDLPQNAYIFDFRAVNTIYQEKMISFAERFSSNDSSITSDTTTRWQIYGFANESFSSRHIWYSPLGTSVNKENLEWDIFLLHYGERSGPLNEKVEYRNREAIEKLRNTLGNVVYDNGESFVIAH